MNSAPSQRQKEIRGFLESEMCLRRLMPTLREIAARFHFASPNAAREHLRSMERKGMLSLIPRKARGIVLKVSTANGIPVLGRIVAGNPQAAIRDAGEFVAAEPTLFRGGELFALRVRGDSMKDAGILSGDFAVFNCQAVVNDGEIAAVQLDDDETATLKRVFCKRDRIVLRGENSDFSDIVIQGKRRKSVRVLGKYVGLVRPGGGLS